MTKIKSILTFCYGIVLAVLSCNNVSAWINLSDTPCGISGRGARIVGGEAAGGALPWAAGLWRGGAHQCGAVVLAAQWLVTAGHCICSGTDDFFSARVLKVVAGIEDLSKHESTSQNSKKVANIIPHPLYVCSKAKNDIALIQTEKEMLWSASLRPACLPSPKAPSFEGANGLVAGWGWTQEDRIQGDRSATLLKVSVLVMDNAQCTSWYSSKGSTVKIGESQMCAGHEEGGRDACWADSGGPLTLRSSSGRVVLVGVVSTGVGCGRPKLPGVYTRVSKYTEWISRHVNSEVHLSSREEDFL